MGPHIRVLLGIVILIEANRRMTCFLTAQQKMSPHLIIYQVSLTAESNKPSISRIAQTILFLQTIHAVHLRIDC